MNRYEQARETMSLTSRATLQKLVARARIQPAITQIMRCGVQLTVSASFEGGRLRVVTSRPNKNCAALHRSGRGKLPTWDDLVAIRSCVWPDGVEVVQVMPPASEGYVNIAECAHLFGPDPAETCNP